MGEENGNGRSILDESPRAIAAAQRKQMIDFIVALDAGVLLPHILRADSALTPQAAVQRAFDTARELDTQMRAHGLDRQPQQAPSPMAIPQGMRR